MSNPLSIFLKKPIRYVLMKEKTPTGIGLQSNEFASKMKPFLNLHKIRHYELSIKGKPYFGYVSMLLNKLIPVKKANGEILHCSDMSVTPFLSDKPDIVEIWDTIPFDRLWLSNNFTSALNMASYIPHTLEASEIVTHSRFTHDNVKRLFNKDSAIISGGINMDEFQNMNVKKELGSILCVSAYYEHKNILNLVAACAIISQGMPITLRLTGRIREPMRQWIDVIAKDYPELVVIHTGYVSRKMLIELYNLSEIYCSMSLTEGFGLTPVEAMACETQPILSDIPSHRDIAGNKALYANPLNVREIADTIISAFSSGPKDDLRKYAEVYDWSNIIPLWVGYYQRKFGLDLGG